MQFVHLLLKSIPASALVGFFFSSRRRHTRSKRDWSSDVCSSDLLPAAGLLPQLGRLHHRHADLLCADPEIGRASCRERGLLLVGAAVWKKKEVSGGEEGSCVDVLYW